MTTDRFRENCRRLAQHCRECAALAEANGTHKGLSAAWWRARAEHFERYSTEPV